MRGRRWARTTASNGKGDQYPQNSFLILVQSPKPYLCQTVALDLISTLVVAATFTPSPLQPHTMPAPKISASRALRCPPSEKVPGTTGTHKSSPSNVSMPGQKPRGPRTKFYPPSFGRHGREVGWGMSQSGGRSATRG